jgi:hypothetical protein
VVLQSICYFQPNHKHMPAPLNWIIEYAQQVKPQRPLTGSGAAAGILLRRRYATTVERARLTLGRHLPSRWPANHERLKLSVKAAESNVAERAITAQESADDDLVHNGKPRMQCAKQSLGQLILRRDAPSAATLAIQGSTPPSFKPDNLRAIPSQDLIHICGRRSQRTCANHADESLGRLALARLTRHEHKVEKKACSGAAFRSGQTSTAKARHCWASCVPVESNWAQVLNALRICKYMSLVQGSPLFKHDAPQCAE